MSLSGPANAIANVRVKLRRATVRRELQAVIAGKKATLSLRLDEHGIDVARGVQHFARHLPPRSEEMLRIVNAFDRSGLADAALDGLGSSSVQQRIAGARVVGALRNEKAIPWLAMLVSSGQPAQVDAAARALGSVGGWRSAHALVTAVHRGRPQRVLITELARCAPDLYIEAGLSRNRQPTIVSALAVAAGLRRRHTAIGPLITLLVRGNRAQRAISCRALAWIGAGSAIPLITEALSDREWQVRLSAVKALGALNATDSYFEVKALLADRNLRVRRAAFRVTRRLEGRLVRHWDAKTRWR